MNRFSLIETVDKDISSDGKVKKDWMASQHWWNNSLLYSTDGGRRWWQSEEGGREQTPDEGMTDGHSLEDDLL